MKTVLTIVLTMIAAATVAAMIVHSGGLLNFAGDEPHPALIESTIALARERFIETRSKDLTVPDLGDPKLVADGAAHYVPMCAGCHLGPGTEDTEIRRGLYPQPPNLSQPEQHADGHDHDDPTGVARRQFWIIKHGIKMTGMPAWGSTHSDEDIWGLVAFLQKLPGMSAAEYMALQQQASGGDADAHSHGARDDGPADAHVDPPGSKPHGHAKQPSSDGHDHEH